jgi:hypothetical protein
MASKQLLAIVPLERGVCNNNFGLQGDFPPFFRGRGWLPKCIIDLLFDTSGRVAVMGFKLDRVHVWSGEVADQAGGMSSKLALLAQAGANLEYIFTRRQSDKPGTGILYVAPVSGSIQVRAARAAGLTETFNPVVLRVEGDNQAGLGHRLTQQWALAGISLQGLTMVVIGNKFVGYAAFDSVPDANRAAQILADLGSAG